MSKNPGRCCTLGERLVLDGPGVIVTASQEKHSHTLNFHIQSLIVVVILSAMTNDSVKSHFLISDFLPVIGYRDLFKSKDSNHCS